MKKFEQLGLSVQIIEVLDKMGFETPTPIQEQSIPLLLTKDPTDFIGLAQTGTGKTAAFGLPLIDLLDEEIPAVQALILSPTRELSQQTAVQIKQYSANRKKLNVESVYGGAAIVAQIKALKKVTQVVVATPGRLRDLIQRKAVRLNQVKYIILDEADEMLNMGFKEEIDEILLHTPERKAIWLFSATMPSAIRKIVSKYMDSPAEVSVLTREKTNKDITHAYVVTKSSNKIPALRRFLDIHPEMRGVMFCRTKRETQQIADDMGAMDYGVEALHGDMSQAQRDSVMKRFKSRSMQLLIATDVAARGIDVDDLSHVIHHTVPDQIEYYTHRSGRTGRAGKKGVSLVFINPRETRKITELEKKIGIQFEKIEVPAMEELKYSRINNWANLILNTKVDKSADEILNHLEGQLAHLSKEDLLKRLITTQLDHLTIGAGESNDLNERFSNKKPESKRNKDFNRYFVNIGTIDGITRSDLIHFLSDISNVDRKYFGDVAIHKNHSFFDVDKSRDRGMTAFFKDIQINDRSIRVNRDEESEGRKSKAPSGQKYKEESWRKSYNGRRSSNKQKRRR